MGHPIVLAVEEKKNEPVVKAGVRQVFVRVLLDFSINCILCGTGRLQCFSWHSDLQTVLCWRDYGYSRTKIWNVAKKSDHLTASPLAL